MKPTVSFLLILILLGCRGNPGNNPEDQTRAGEQNEAAPAITRFPENLAKVLEAHGGLSSWQEKQTLRFQIPEDEGTETHTIDLQSRKDRVEGPSYTLGFDGEKVWLADPGHTFKGNAAFYHNLMFYFFAMPFVLADDGIRYGPADDLVYQGKTYPGIKIGYDRGVGASPKDEYYLYYDPETQRMAWLAYTVTFFQGEPSDDLHWLRYDRWQEVNGLLVPESLTWYNNSGKAIGDARDSVHFQGVSLMENRMPEGFYGMPSDAEVVLPKDQ